MPNDNEEIPTIHVLMGRILAELPAIGKDRRNEEEKFMFRGIDDVLNALNPILSKHGVFYVPDVLERVSSQRSTRSGGTMYEVDLHVRFTFYGPAGDSVQASGWGEGTDMGDKATNKAMTGAMKYVLFQTFAIATQEASEADADRHSPEETVLPPALPNASEQQIVAVLNRLRPVLDAAGGEYPEEWKARVAQGAAPGTYRIESLEAMATGDRPRCLEASIGVMNDILDAVPTWLDETAQGEMGPCTVCGSARSDRGLIHGVVRCLNATACRKRAEDKAASEPVEGIVCAGCGELVTELVPTRDAEGLAWHPECWGAT